MANYTDFPDFSTKIFRIVLSDFRIFRNYFELVGKVKKKKGALAKNIVARRKALGFKNAQKFAEFAKIPYGTLRDIEAGYSDGWADTKEAIATALGCTVYELTAPREITEGREADHDLAKLPPLSAKEIAEEVRRSLSDEIQSVSKRDNAELAALKEKLNSIPPEIFSSWPQAELPVRAVCLYLLTGNQKHLKAVGPALRAKMEKGFGMLGLRPPTKARRANK